MIEKVISGHFERKFPRVCFEDKKCKRKFPVIRTIFFQNDTKKTTSSFLYRLHKINLFKLISGRCLVRFLVIVSLLFFRWKYENRSSCVFGPICIRVSEGHPPPHPKISHSHFTPHYSKKWRTIYDDGQSNKLHVNFDIFSDCLKINLLISQGEHYK